VGKVVLKSSENTPDQKDEEELQNKVSQGATITLESTMAVHATSTELKWSYAIRSKGTDADEKTREELTKVTITAS
jgi:hypothetical protein